MMAAFIFACFGVSNHRKYSNKDATSFIMYVSLKIRAVIRTEGNLGNLKDASRRGNEG